MHSSSLLDAHDRTAPPGLGVLDDGAPLGRHLGRPAARRSSPVAPEHVLAVPVHHGGEASRVGRSGLGGAPVVGGAPRHPVELALPARECQSIRRGGPCPASRPPEPTSGGERPMSEDRRLRVLRAIVQDYVETSEPVGSKALLERHQLGVSAATVRNDMAALEEEGLIAAPHTSAGRVPTDAGYRLFVDRLSAVKPMSGAEQRAIAHFLEGADRPRRRRRPHGSPARLADPPGRGGPVPVAGPVFGAARRAGADRRRAAARRAHHDDRAGRAAGHRRRGRPARTPTTRPRSRRCAPSSTARRPGAASPRRPPSSPSCPSASSRGCASSSGRSGALCRTRSSRSARSGSCSRARPTSPASDPTSRRASARSSRPSRSTSCCSSCSAPSPSRAAASPCASGTRTPTPACRRRRWSAPGTAPGPTSWPASVCSGPTRMDYPTTMAAVRAVATYVSRILAE